MGRAHVHPALHKRMVETAKEWRIPTPVTHRHTLAEQRIRHAGPRQVPAILLSIPLRYMHTPIETLDYEDVKHTGRLMALFIAGLDYEFVEGLRCF